MDTREITATYQDALLFAKKTTDEEIEKLKGHDKADAVLAGMVLASQVHDTALKTIAFVYGTTKGQVLEDMQRMGK